ncbi:uncharacterized protein LOC106738121 [Alligator mississippiensis]|uniref:uncharacterized protein LOC106738121 n=1 Tax=Alligator mississippiensis TaxID=8496 RepID=UPI000711FCCB|nr:uncharacterized protein LOC106738121 [Alligator mississippiensis]
MGPALHPPDSPSARGEATVRRLEAAQPLSGTPGAIRMRHLHQVQRTRRDGIQEELLRAERAHLREAREYRQQVLAEFRRSRRDQALFLEEVRAGRVALQQLLAKIMEERQLAQDSYRELRQLQASINTAIQEKLRVSQQLLAAIPTLTAQAAVPQPMPAPVLAPGPPDQPTFPPPGTGPSWEHFAWLVAQVVPQQPPQACHSHRGVPLLPPCFLVSDVAAAYASEEEHPLPSPEQPGPQPRQHGLHTWSGGTQGQSQAQG